MDPTATTPSNPNIEVPPYVRATTNGDFAPGVPHLPPSVARHPLYAMITIVVSIVATLLGGVYAMVPTDKQLEEVKEEVRDLRDHVQRSLDKSDDRVGRLEKWADGQQRTNESVQTFHIGLQRWQDSVLRRIDKLEDKHAK